MEPISMGTAAIMAGGGLLKDIGGGIMASQRERDKLRREALLAQGKTAAEIALQEGQQKSNTLADLIAAYRSAMLK